MKIVLIKNNLLIIFYSLLITACAKKEEIENMKNSFLVKLPFIEQKSFLIKNDKMRVEMDKVLTQNTIDYQLGFEGEKLFPIPFNRNADDFYPILDTRLDSLIEKNFGISCDSCFVLKYEYGTGNIKWNYLFKIKSQKIYLERLYFIEPYNSQNDTLAYISKIDLDKPISTLNIKTIKDSMNRAEQRNIKKSLYIFREKLK